MASRPYDCDRERLQHSLEDRLTEAEQAELAEHLEACPHCRGELERMAAASQYWSDAAMLRGEPPPGTSPTDPFPEDPGHEDEDEPSDRDADWRDWLDPPDPDRPEALGRLGSYDILDILGRGGMGLVLKARDPALERMVAIKLLNPGLAHGATARRRFEREARAIAAVGHEHIVAIHAVDVFRGLPYLVMQYVPGRSLQEKLDASGPLEARDILRIGTQAARALAAAHAQGVVHRDIKPANILLENCVERVRLTDFGLARAIDDASLTHSGLIAGTPQYMAPEQARGDPVDARADLFALGAVLYAMAAGRPPFRADSAMAVLRRICDDRHRPIRELNPDVPAWLEATIDRLLAKDPDDRFPTAAEVAELLERGLAHLQQPTVLPPPIVPGTETIEPNPPAAAPRSRIPRRLAMAAVIMVAAVAGIGATDAAGLTQVSDFVATILRIKTADGTLLIKADDPDVKVRIDDDEVVIGGAGPQEVRVRAGQHRIQTIKDGKPVREKLVAIARGGKEIVDIEFEPADAALAAGSDPRLGSREVVRGLSLAAGLAPPPATGTAPAAPRKKDTHPRLRSKNARLTAIIEPAEAWPGETVKLRVTATLDPGYHIYKQVGKDLPPGNWPIYTSFDLFDTDGLEPQGEWTASRDPIRQKEAAFPDLPFVEYHEDEVTWSLELKVPPDIASGQKTIRVQAGYMICNDTSCGPPGRWTLPAATLRVSPGNRHEGEAIYGAAGPDSPARARGMVWSLAYSPDGRRLAIGQQAIDRAESILRVWDFSRRSDTFWMQHDNAGYRNVAFSPDGKLLAAGVFDGTLSTYEDIGGAWKDDHNENQGSALNALVFLPGSRVIAAGDWDGWVRFHGPDVEANRRPIRHPGRVGSLAVSPDGKMLAVGGEAKTVQIYDLSTRQLRATLEGHDLPVKSLDFSPDGKRLVSAGGRFVRFWDTSSWRENAAAIQHTPEVIGVKFSPDGKLLAISDGEALLPHFNVLQTSVMLWDMSRHAEVRRLWGHTNTIWALAFSPDGKTLASGSADQTVKFWDVATGRLRETLVPGESGTSAGMGAVSVRNPEAGADRKKGP
jgi:serine/threonine protein kinase